MTPIPKERIELLGDIGDELRTRMAAEVTRTRRKRRTMVGGALAVIVAAAVALAGLPQLERSGPEVAAADVLQRAAAKLRSAGLVGDGQYLHQQTVSYAYHYKSDTSLGTGAKVDYEYYVRVESDGWFKRDGSGLLLAHGNRDAVFLNQADRQAWLANGSPQLPDVGGGRWYVRYPPGNAYDFNRRLAQAGNRLTDYLGDPEVVRSTLRTYGLTTAALSRAAGNQAKFNSLVMGRVRSLGAKLAARPSRFKSADADRVATSLIIGLITNWSTGMPPSVRAAFLDLLAETGGGTLEFDPDFRDEAGNRLIALGTNRIGDDPRKVYDLLLFDPVTFEQRGIRQVFGDGRIWATDLSDFSVSDTEGAIPSGYVDAS